jgi:hypothetical protein
MGQDTKRGQAKIEQGHLASSRTLWTWTRQRLEQQDPRNWRRRTRQARGRRLADSIDIDGKSNEPKATEAHSNVAGSSDTDNEASSDDENGLMCPP